MTYHDGSKFVGKWKNGKRHGQGTYTWCFYCSWCSSLPGGTNSSISSFADGRKYEGEWKDGVYHGHGTYTFSDGSKFSGEWRDGKKYGQGTFYYTDGSVYVGELKGGERNGQGTYTSFEGDKYVGEFKDEKFWNGTTYEIGGNIFGKWVNGKLEVNYPPIPINKL